MFDQLPSFSVLPVDTTLDEQLILQPSTYLEVGDPGTLPPPTK